VYVYLVLLLYVYVYLVLLLYVDVHLVLLLLYVDVYLVLLLYVHNLHTHGIIINALYLENTLRLHMEYIPIVRQISGGRYSNFIVLFSQSH